MNKKNFVPLLLVILMILNIVAAIIFKYWLFMFIATELILFHMIPPFAIIISVVAYKFKLGFWFKQNDWEINLYRQIKIKKWKNKFPTYNLSLFAINPASKENLIKAMIQSENVHLILFFVSYIPLFLGKYFGHWPILIILSMAFSLCHIPFVLIQRYNLPRVEKMHC